MGKSISEKIMKKKEEERSIKLPSSLFTEKGVKDLDRALDTGNLFVVSQFYKNYADYFDKEAFKSIEKSISRNRNLLTKEDKKLAKNIYEGCKGEESDMFLDFAGTLIYISDLLEDFHKEEIKSKTIKVSIMLFCFLNMVELTSKYVGGLLISKINKEKKDQEFKIYLKKFEDGKHAEIGSLMDTMKSLFHINESFIKKTVFEESRMVRNVLAHSNIFYDSKKKVIYQSNSKEYSFEKFEKEFKRLYEFILELLFNMNDSSTEIWSRIENLCKGMGKTFFNYSRAGYGPKFNEIILRYMKEEIK